MNIFNIIIQKVSATLTVIMLSLGFASPVVSPPVQVAPVESVVVATTTVDIPVATPVEKSVGLVAVIAVVPEKATTTIATTTIATTTPVVVATSTPVVVPEVPLQTTNQSAPTVAPPVFIFQIQSQPEAPVTSAPIKMETLYKITKGEEITLDDSNEQAIRDFAENLNDQINWKKQMRTIKMLPSGEGDTHSVYNALLANGYTLTQK